MSLSAVEPILYAFDCDHTEILASISMNVPNT